MNQKERVLRLLQRNERGVCCEQFVYALQPGIPRVAARIHELKAQGWNIKTEPCDLHDHKQGGTTKKRHVDKYRLVTFILNRSDIKVDPRDQGALNE